MWKPGKYGASSGEGLMADDIWLCWLMQEWEITWQDEIKGTWEGQSCSFITMLTGEVTKVPWELYQFRSRVTSNQWTNRHQLDCPLLKVPPPQNIVTLRTKLPIHDALGYIPRPCANYNRIAVRKIKSEKEKASEHPFQMSLILHMPWPACAFHVSCIHATVGL